MEIKDALIRAVRTAAQTLAGVLAALPIADSMGAIQTLGPTFLIAVYSAVLAAVISFLQNVSIDQRLNLPKG